MSEELEIEAGVSNLGLDDEEEIIKIFTKTEYNYKHDVHLDSAFGSNPIDYRELFQKLRQMSTKDEMTLHSKSYGGDCQMAFALCHYVRQCKGKVTIHVESPCYSMGAILACCGDKLDMNPGTFLKFHNYSGGEYGKGGELMLGLKQRDMWFKGQLKHFCTPFLTDKELERIANDGDIYIFEGKPGLAKRIKRHFK